MGRPQSFMVISSSSLYLINIAIRVLSGYLKIFWILRTLFGNFSVD